MLSEKNEPWYVSMRAEAAASLLFIRIPGIQVQHNKQTSPDFLVFLPDSNGNPTNRLLGIEVKATAHPVFRHDGTPKISIKTQSSLDKLTVNSTIPFCFLYFTTDAEKGEQAWAKWLAKPREDGGLSTGDEAGSFFPIDEPKAASLVRLASEWYENRRPASH